MRPRYWGRSWHSRPSVRKSSETAIKGGADMRFVRSTMGWTLCTLLVLGVATLGAQKVIKKTGGQAGSPHETVEYMVHGAKITVNYGRPFIKGRAIDAVAPKGQAYRLGADEATILTTDKPLMIGALMLQPGSYT